MEEPTIPGVVIESGIAVPPRATGAVRSSPYWDLAARMKVGDSVVLSKAAASSLVSVLRKLGYAIATRAADGGKKRVWKLEQKEIGNGRDDQARLDGAVKARPRNKAENSRAAG